MNAYDKLKAHLIKHMYKRGANKGEAPADARRRGKSAFRVCERGLCMAVRLHRTDILRAYPDGRLILDCDGWAHSPTTKENLRFALNLCGIHAYIGSRVAFSKSQLCYVNNTQGAVIYYDGMELDGTGKVTSELKPFMMRRRDRAQTKKYEEDIKASGFKDMFKIIHGSCTVDDIPSSLPAYKRATRNTVREFTIDPDCANEWRGLIAGFAWDVNVRWDYSTKQVNRTYTKRTASATWTLLTNDAKTEMYEEVESTTFTL